MFKSNCRVENTKGIKFYEQDILVDDYVYTRDLEMAVAVDYVSPGFGVALINNEGSISNELFLFRIGYRECSIIHKLNNIQSTIKRNATTAKPYDPSMILRFSKKGKKIVLSADGYGVLLEYSLKRSIDRYSIALYSNGGNTVKYINIASDIPSDWNVNMANTHGGYIKFAKNSFELDSCMDNAEVQQQNLLLKAGNYFLNYKAENKNNKLDVACYVFDSNSKEIFDDKKNLLKDNAFTLLKDSKINIKFKGTSGKISNVQITDDSDDGYVATDNSVVYSQPSVITIHLKDLKRIEINCIVMNTPDNNEDEEFYLFSNNIETISTEESGVAMNKLGSYNYNIEDQNLDIYEEGVFIKSLKLSSTTSLRMFKNINAVITKLDLIRRDGTVINLVVSNINRKYIPASITSPIIALNTEDIPLDLSSSYRIVKDNGLDRYIFTNTEREYFEAINHIVVDKPISEELGAIKVYGILKGATTNFENLLRIPTEGNDTIDLFCREYEVILESSLQEVNKTLGDIIIEDVSKYDMLIIDYLKAESYCINYDSLLKVYEVDISAKEDVSLIYDHNTSVSGTTITNEIENYKITEIKPENNYYIVLRTDDI
jgi:hypothetical protein